MQKNREYDDDKSRNVVSTYIQGDPTFRFRKNRDDYNDNIILIGLYNIYRKLLTINRSREQEASALVGQIYLNIYVLYVL